MSAFKSQQRLLTIRDRAFHFVSYEGQPANVRRGEAASPAMWYLMVEGRRCPALLWEPDQSLDDVDQQLIRWATENAFRPLGEVGAVASPARPAPSQRPGYWWGPT